MAFNIAEGMLMVTGPWLAKNHLPGGLVHGQLATAAVAMTVIAGLPALYLIFAVSDESPAPTAGHTPKPAVYDAENRH